MKYWITNPKLTPAHDQQIEAGALADWSRSGWQVRDDQADVVPADEPADPREPVAEPPVINPKTPASEPVKTNTKGEV